MCVVPRQMSGGKQTQNTAKVQFGSGKSPSHGSIFCAASLVFEAGKAGNLKHIFKAVAQLE